MQIISDDINIVDSAIYNLYKDKNYATIAVIGKARTGKSSLLNIIASFLTGKSVAPFVSKKGPEHVTKGVHYWFHDQSKIVLLDFRGTDSQNAVEDVKLTMMACMLADIIIVNEQKMIYNSTLKTNLEPIIMFGDKRNIISKSNELIFRLVDCEFDLAEIEICLKNSIYDEVTADQYTSTRVAVKKFFDKISAYGTFVDKNDSKLLAQNEYGMLLINKSNGFLDFVLRR